MVHENTLSCVNKAKDLVKSDSIDSLRYAALQLRMAIEYLFYELIPLYQEELPDDIASSKWQPREILDAILECDPDADKDSIIAFSPSDQTENERRFDTVLERKAPNKKMLRDYYHRLGAYAECRCVSVIFLGFSAIGPSIPSAGMSIGRTPSVGV